MEGRAVGRYVVGEPLASGGVGTVHVGRTRGADGESVVVAIKTLHPQLADDPEFVAMLVDEGRLAARVRHPNVVATIEVVAAEGELLLVMEYVAGETIARLVARLRKRGQRMPPTIAATLAHGMLLGLHAAHEARDASGAALDIVHRDVSPQNVIVGADGVPRVTDFGIAKAVGRLQVTREGQIKGKAAYMAPEQIRGTAVDARTDVYAASIVFWEMLTGERLFAGDSAIHTMTLSLEKKVVPPSALAEVPAALDAIVLRGLSRDAGARYASAMEMARAIQDAVPLEPQVRVAEWLADLAADTLTERAALVASSLPDRAAESPKDARPTSRLRHFAPIALAALLAIVAGAVAVHAGATRPAPPERDASTDAATTSAPASSEGTIAPAASSSPAAPPSPSPSATEPSSPSVTATSATSTARARRPPANVPSHRPSCDPPYTVDANGYHIPKPQCL